MQHTLDITKERCPMTMVKVKLKLSQINDGDVLDVLLSEGEPLESVPRTAEEQGHRVEDIRKDGVFYHVVIRK
ncbi:sulfurtransferase TusA family protein [Prosthecochloris sp. SCSIO W1101]|uniref:sulfurtransferase TusA family protein n=1 Tax=Prosthecochloris sp. SCSIO W1101 TaxID=2992242 RepID=UPI00223DDCBC|nr:sulfurtransferase TusA family protein [Prosthecochloris sp. SCSIO W1101]UZJ40638.1 sulfurtransferase TusA family protein [Prosthecochloris sp. SCSIO W1101]